jgi:dTDP-4-amino-4,6-dideoxygalactose transaminase
MAQLALYGGKPVRTRPYPSWPQGGDEELSYLRQVLKSPRWFAGPRGDDPEALGTLFGERFARLHGARFGLPVANGSVAIEIALRALGIGPGAEVIVPAYTFVSTATSVLLVGGIPVFADIEADTYCLDPQDVASRIGSNTRAIIPVHLGGQMADMEAIQTLARTHNLAVVEDCAQAIDSAWLGKKAGTWGELGTFSFQANKTITSGEGGLVMTNDAALKEEVVALRAFGRSIQEEASLKRSSAFASQTLSGNYRLSEFQAAVLLAQLDKFALQDEKRRSNAERLTEGLQEIPGIKHIRREASASKHGYYYYLVRYDREQFAGLNPDQFCALLNAEGIPFLPGDREPVYRHPVFHWENLQKDLCPEVLERYRRVVHPDDRGCPAAEEACRSTLILRHPVLLGDPKDMDDIVEVLAKIKKNIHEIDSQQG